MKRQELFGLPALSGKRMISVCVVLLLFSGGFYGCQSKKTDADTPVVTTPVVTTPVTTTVVISPNQKLPTAPHYFDIYRSTGADKAVIFLHGGGGSKFYLACQLGINLQDVSSGVTTTPNYDSVNEKMLIDNAMVAVFPQGQAVSASPQTYTWDNYVMKSGQNDMQFIRDLVSYIAVQYQISKFYIVGHSNGGMMANRIWCEAPELFEGYVAIAGPPSEHFNTTPCAPTTVKPYLAIVGSEDNMLQIPFYTWSNPTWKINPIFITADNTDAFADPVVIGERWFLPSRVTKRCGGGETVSAGDADAVVNGTLRTWSYCSGSIQLIRVENGTHLIEDLDSQAGHTVLELLLPFITK